MMYSISKLAAKPNQTQNDRLDALERWREDVDRRLEQGAEHFRTTDDVTKAMVESQLAISSTWSAYDGRPALDLVKTHIRSELSAVSDRVTKLESCASKLVLMATDTGKRERTDGDIATAGTPLYSLGKTRSEVFQAVQAGTDVEVRFHDESLNVDVILRPAFICPGSDDHEMLFSGMFAYNEIANFKTASIFSYALKWSCYDDDNFVLLRRRID